MALNLNNQLDDVDGLNLLHGSPAAAGFPRVSYRGLIEPPVVVFMNFRYFVTVVLNDASVGIAPLPPV